MSADTHATSGGAILEGLPPLMANLFEPIGSEGNRFGLVGGYCTQCDRYFFPLAEQCSDCRGPLTRMIVGETGSVYSYTVVRTKAPFGLPEPYAVAYIDVAEAPLRIFGLIDPDDIGGLDVGTAVRLTVKAIGVDALGRQCLRPVFGLADAGAKRCGP